MAIQFLCPFRFDFTPNTGSNIRIKAYSEAFLDSEIDFLFIAPSRPEYIPNDCFKLFALKHSIKKIFLLHNILFPSLISKPLSILLWLYIKRLKPVVRLVDQINSQAITIIHQDSSVALLLKLKYNISTIYDIHGILRIQKEYLDGMKAWNRIWFRISLVNEALTFKNIDKVNSISNKMSQYIKNEMNFSGKAYCAPDGIYYGDTIEDYKDNDLKNMKRKYNIDMKQVNFFFFGSLKKIGGILLLAEAFVEITREFDKANLIIAGTGQCRSHLENIIRSNHLENRVSLYDHIPYNELFKVIYCIDYIVIPDLENIYNQMIPHIKTYDAIKSGKPIIIPDFQVNKEILSPLDYHVQYYKPSNKADLISQLSSAIRKGKTTVQSKTTNYHHLSYLSRSLELIKQYKKDYLIPDNN